MVQTGGKDDVQGVRNHLLHLFNAAQDRVIWMSTAIKAARALRPSSFSDCDAETELERQQQEKREKQETFKR